MRFIFFMKKEYIDLRDEQINLLSEYPYSKVVYYVYDEDTNCIIDIMKVSEIDNTYESMEEIVGLLNKHRNTIAGLKVTRKRMRNDIRRLSKELSHLKLCIRVKYDELKEEFGL